MYRVFSQLYPKTLIAPMASVSVCPKRVYAYPHILRWYQYYSVVSFYKTIAQLTPEHATISHEITSLTSNY